MRYSLLDQSTPRCTYLWLKVCCSLLQISEGSIAIMQAIYALNLASTKKRIRSLRKKEKEGNIIALRFS